MLYTMRITMAHDILVDTLAYIIVAMNFLAPGHHLSIWYRCRRFTLTLRQFGTHNKRMEGLVIT